MRIFIVYASAGAGHKKVAEAVYETAISDYGKEAVVLIDILDYMTPFFKFLYSKGYIFVISRMKWLWAILFYSSDARFLSLFNGRLRCFFNEKFCKRFLSFIGQENPDVIISTHFLVNELVSLLKARNAISSKFISVVTDFGVHNFWIAKHVEVYAVASEETRSILIAKNVDKNRISVLGIPIRKQFQRPMDKESIRKKLCIEGGRLTVLILTGGIGIGPIYEIVRSLNDQLQLIVVCGSNKKLFNQLGSLGYKNLKVFGWVDAIEELMLVSDIVVTKPGGSTVSECLVMGLPMIFFSIIPGQESFNAKIISKLGFGVIANYTTIKEAIYSYKESPLMLASTKEKISLFAHRDSTRDVLKLAHG